MITNGIKEHPPYVGLANYPKPGKEYALFAWQVFQGEYDQHSIPMTETEANTLLEDFKRTGSISILKMSRGK